MASEFYLGVDAGGSTCRVRIVDDAGRVLGTASGEAANTYVGIDRLHAVIAATCREAGGKAGMRDADLASVRAGMGIAGISRAGMKERVLDLSWPFRSLAVTSDAVIATLGAHMGGDGAVLILGTGSIGMIRHGEEYTTVGGYGFPISDEGSGAALGLSAIRHALRALDGRTRPTPLSDAVTRQFDHAIPRVIAWMDEATPRSYARFAPLVFEHAEQRDEIAVSIVRDAAVHVERFLEIIFDKGADRCALMGGIAPRMLPWLRARIVDRLVAPLGDALDGAILLAGAPLRPI